MNEEILLEEIKNEPQKFGEIYEAFYKKIFGYVFRRTTDYDASKDIAAETFLKAFSGINNFRWRNISLLYWLYKIATNEINKYYNEKKYMPESINRIYEEYGVDITNYSDAETERSLLEEELERHQDFLKINGIIKKLDTKYQDVISLRFFEQKSIKEISAILNKKEGTVKSLLSRGINKIKLNVEGK